MQILTSHENWSVFVMNVLFKIEASVYDTSMVCNAFNASERTMPRTIYFLLLISGIPQI